MKKEVSLYIHIPFCFRKCLYCDFLSSSAKPEEIKYYSRVIQKEIKSFEPISNIYSVKSIYFGGGTPSYIDSIHIAEIMQQIYSSFDINEDAEITIECNPGTITEEKLKTYRTIGINRLSFGVQSANNNELQILGRIHTFEQFRDNYNLARRLGFDNISVDLMSGIPNQTLDSFKKTLDMITELAPDHISVYSLILEEGTPFFDTYSKLPASKELPDEHIDRLMYHYTKTYLDERGYDRYEISNYAREGRESKHNIVYWTLGDYIGFGLGASSYFDGRRFSNPRDKESYYDYAPSAYESHKFFEIQPKKETMEEFMFLGLRMMKGISVNEFNLKFGESFDELYGGVTSRMLEMDMLTFDGVNLKLTDKGIDVSNRVLSNYLLPKEE